ncbi:MAG: ferrous iron transport protein B [Colwellia sp.]
MNLVKHFALIGFANSGKSTFFNLLLNSDKAANKKIKKQHVGNWSGVTVAAKQTAIKFNEQNILLSDLPGLSSLAAREEQGKDLTITQDFIKNNNIDYFINVVDINQLSRQLSLTTELIALGLPVVVVLNKVDSKQAVDIDIDKLSQKLGCQVVAVSAQDKGSLETIDRLLTPIIKSNSDNSEINYQAVIKEKYTPEEINKLIDSVQIEAKEKHKEKLTDKLDAIILHPLAGIPIFLGMMYLLFMFAINVGSAFIDFFDILSGTAFVDYPLYWLEPYNLPAWLLTIIEGVGSGVQTVATFIPVIVCLFIGLSLLESTGYLARAAFVVDSLMQKIGLPGKAFVPLIVGFGCTVPAVMSARVLDSERERITTVMMAPFMSCGARLPVYALFAAAFFPDNGQNLVFLLYLVGIAAAIGTGYLLKKTVLSGGASLNIMELPDYEFPSLYNIAKRVWQRTYSFVTGAGKTIVIVVCLLNFLNSIGTDGKFGNQDSENSILSQGAKLFMPVLSPMGVKEENWQAGVGIITGIFAKEVLVATFNSLYSPSDPEEGNAPSITDSWDEAVDSIKENLLGIAPDDPLGMDVGDLSDLEQVAQEQEVELSTYQVMQAAFAGTLGAFSYLLFILLYTPCVAAMGAIKNEVGSRWAAFAAIWSFVLAYLTATLCFQIGSFFVAPLMASVYIILVFLAFAGIFFWLKRQGKKVLTIPVSVRYS